MEVVLVAKTGFLSSGLQALLGSLSDVKVIAVVDNCTDAYQKIESLGKDPQDLLLLLDGSIAFDASIALVSQVKASHSFVTCLVITVQAYQRSLALEAGADEALLAGFRVEELVHWLRNHQMA